MRLVPRVYYCSDCHSVIQLTEREDDKWLETNVDCKICNKRKFNLFCLSYKDSTATGMLREALPLK